MAAAAHPHPAGSVDPARDLENLDLEFILADLAMVDRRQHRALAVSVGNVHLNTEKTSGVDLDALRAIEAVTRLPLVLQMPEGVRNVIATAGSGTFGAVARSRRSPM